MAGNLNKDILEDLKCPGCKFFMHPPIFQCSIGHSFCQDCFHKMTKCSICDGEKNNTCRNWVLEQIHTKLMIPCTKGQLGCMKLFLGKDIVDHQDGCGHLIIVRCPFSRNGACNYSGVKAKLHRHLSEKNHRHSGGYFVQDEDCDTPFCRMFELDCYQNEETLRKINVFYAYGQFFKFVYKIDPYNKSGK